jgi:class 3 adenylate cyclase
MVVCDQSSRARGDSFVVAFGRASDAVACALDLQLAPLAPIRLRVGVHTGEVQLRDAGNYIDTDECWRLRSVIGFSLAAAR